MLERLSRRDARAVVVPQALVEEVECLRRDEVLVVTRHEPAGPARWLLARAARSRTPRFRGRVLGVLGCGGAENARVPALLAVAPEDPVVVPIELDVVLVEVRVQRVGAQDLAEAHPRAQPSPRLPRPRDSRGCEAVAR